MDAVPAIVTVAITGSVPRKRDNPAVPIDPTEQVESAHEAFEAGAALVHIHVRDDDEGPSLDPERFRAVQEGVRRYCPGMIVQFSTSGRAQATGADRAAALPLGPDMASLTTGSVNFRDFTYLNDPALIQRLASEMQRHRVKPEIEIFDAAMLYAASRLAVEGLLARPLHVQFVLGIPNALPLRREVMDFLLSELRALEPDATWGAAGIGKNQLAVNRLCLERGGHVRTGLEDNILYEPGRLAVSNAELVRRVVSLMPEYGRRPATPAEARQILGLPDGPAGGQPAR